MDWYYAIDDQQRGPVSDEEFSDLAADGTITLSTLVWRRGMSDWQPYAEVATARRAAAPPASGQARCAECGRAFPVDDMIAYRDEYVCAECKPVFFERVRQGVPLTGEMRYAGFWIRFVAKIVDGLIMMAVGWVVQLVIGLPLLGNASQMSPGSYMAISGLIYFVNMAIGVLYYAGFISKYAATPGKMACGLKIVRSDGSRVTFARAVGRYFAEILSALILYIGYIMVAFDSEKRALHDRICDTRVIHAR